MEESVEGEVEETHAEGNGANDEERDGDGDIDGVEASHAAVRGTFKWPFQPNMKLSEVFPGLPAQPAPC